MDNPLDPQRYCKLFSIVVSQYKNKTFIYATDKEEVFMKWYDEIAHRN